MPWTYEAAVERILEEADKPGEILEPGYARDRARVAARVAPLVIRIERMIHTLPLDTLSELEAILTPYDQPTQEAQMTPERKGNLTAFLTIRSDMPRPKDAPEDWTPRVVADQEAADWREAGYSARVYSRALCADGERLDVWCVLVREPVDLSTPVDSAVDAEGGADDNLTPAG